MDKQERIRLIISKFNKLYYLAFKLGCYSFDEEFDFDSCMNIRNNINCLRSSLFDLLEDIL